MDNSIISKSVGTLTIGRFDGMHVGHQVLFNKARSGAAIVITSDTDDLTPGQMRLHYTSLPCFYYRFDDIKHLEPEEFMSLLKRDFPNAKRVVVGRDFRFGRDRKGDVSTLRKRFSVDAVDEVCIDDIGVHSSIIREFLDSGELERAIDFMGHCYQIYGDVISGQGIGHTELVATLNIAPGKFRIPAHGVYAGYAIIGSLKLPSVIFVGNRESTDGRFSIEVHILGEFSHEVSHIGVEFVHYLRQNQKFDDLSELKMQIFMDIGRAEMLLKGSIGGQI